ncbi:1-acyl-sn-glycerol-3-phosphate acyltransferase [Andreesenia angusta]|uniref:1-acyl-sn-glycerol-3-phosphate acyltransferase n=1 Tax=Andreesenia angusta TaxID=39480 RepID=A0A1S1V9D8_9FIRM|nr:lysophospholipid acyltransferase family protein [Andreesenia angusta]OHW63216.1 1-acyl-sn-glycerol-3-phosphate acyltransferase [Andreesenia angusta]
MFRTLKWFIGFWASLIMLIPKSRKTRVLEESGDFEKRDEMVAEVVPNWARKLIELSGSEVEVVGEENLPKDETVLFVSNHQGNFDIPLLLGYIDKPKAFMAKKEMEKMPMVSTWMKYMQCVFMDRDNPRESLKAIKQGSEKLKEGYSMVIFPEGTRSEDGQLKDFKQGAFKLATKSKVPIVPVTISGSNRIMEKGSIKINPAKVKLVIAEPVYMTEEYEKDTKLLSEKIKSVIEGNLS